LRRFTSRGSPDRHNGWVTTVAANERVFRPQTGLKYLGGFFAYGLGLSALYATTGIGLPCPLRELTGWQCPFCGGTRMGNALLHLDIGAAFAYNPVALIGLTVLGVLGVAWTVEAVGGPAIRLPRVLAGALARVGRDRWLWIGLAAAIVYTVLRNLL
jgi:hypothetical protein